MRFFSSVLRVVMALTFALTGQGLAQSRVILPAGDNTVMQTVRDTVLPRAQAAEDRGLVAGTTTIENVTLRFNMTPAQNAVLDQLVADQANPASSRYHQWLTPEQYGARFGLAASDLAKVTDWLKGEGLVVTGVARSGNFVTLSGTASQIASTFGAPLHMLSAGGETHYSNVQDIALPVGIAGVVSGVTGLNDFHLRAKARTRTVVRPDFTSSLTGNHFLAPGDFYTIYDMNALLNSSLNGTGITIAVMGQTDISLGDVAAFRAASGLSASAPTIKLYGTDPGTVQADLDEAQLDVEWSGAVASGASILYVNSTDVIGGSLTQAIANNVAPILAISYGDCEVGFGAGNIATSNLLFRQAVAQGQTIVGPSGDSGATDCDYKVASASGGLAVDFPASSPYVTAVGGTEFAENGGTYFSTSNGVNSGSALSYIPEAVWNDSGSGNLASGGGGVSAIFSKPSYQVGNGVPNDFSRDVPDISFSASAAHDGYLFCSQGSCTNGYRNAAGNLAVVGGTSISTPAFAGILAVLEQKIKTRVGNANPIIYGLANSTYYGGVFHDVTLGNNASPCLIGTTNCPNGGAIGYAATVGYDLASGWGSLDVMAFVNDWLLVTPTGLVSTTGQTPSSTTVIRAAASGSSVTFTAQVAGTTGGVAPTGTVQFLLDGAAFQSAVPLTGGTATLVFQTNQLSSGTHYLSAAYLGDVTYAGSKGATTFDVVSLTTPDFLLATSTSTTTVASGGTAPGITFSVTPVNGFLGSVSFTASTSSSALAATYSFSVNPVTIASTSVGSTVLTLQAFQTNGQSTGLALTNVKRSGLAKNILPLGVAGALAFAGLLLIPGKRQKRWAGLVCAVFSMSLIAMTGCSSSGTVNASSLITKAAPGTYVITVTATGTTSSGASVSHGTNVTFTVQ